MFTLIRDSLQRNDINEGKTVLEVAVKGATYEIFGGLL